MKFGFSIFLFFVSMQVIGQVNQPLDNLALGKLDMDGLSQTINYASNNAIETGSMKCESFGTLKNINISEFFKSEAFLKNSIVKGNRHRFDMAFPALIVPGLNESQEAFDQRKQKADEQFAIDKQLKILIQTNTNEAIVNTYATFKSRFNLDLLSFTITQIQAGLAPGPMGQVGEPDLMLTPNVLTGRVNCTFQTISSVPDTSKYVEF
jgi:hypothetical protein